MDADVKTLEDKLCAETQVSPSPPVVLDIEHAVVADDPRAWSKARKLTVLATVSAASLIGGLGANIYNPAISQIEEQLHASSGDVALSLSLFIGLQGSIPLVWSTLSEFWGRKRIYLLATVLCLVGSIVAALSKTIGVLIGMRCFQAVGSSAVISLGATTLADIYEPAQRGTMMGIYYSAPLLGPALGPILGGVLTQAFSWRATFWFFAIFVGVCFLSFIPFKDTFRRERSLTYQAALRRRRALLSARGSEAPSLSQVTAVSRAVSPQPATGDEKGSGVIEGQLRDEDVEKQQPPVREAAEVVPMDNIKLTLADVNPVKPIAHVLRRMNNVVILVASGLLFGLSYCISYTCSRTLANEYGYDALKIGLVLISFGIGSLTGSVFGGRYCDHVFKQLKERSGSAGTPEMRLQSTLYFMPCLPLSVVAYGWVCEQHVHVAAICVMLFLTGLFSIAIYTSTLAYIVDANMGRSSSAVAANSAFRGLTAFVATEVAAPLQTAIGDGGLYSLWAGLMVVTDVLILIVWRYGGAWRKKWEVIERSRT